MTSGDKHREIEQAVRRGAPWVVAAYAGARVIGVAENLVLAWWLAPRDFGAAAIAIMIVNACVLFRDLGFRQTIIYYDGDREAAADTAMTFALIFNVAAAVGLYFAAGPIGDYFKEPLSRDLLIILSPTLVLLAYSTVAGALLEKDLRFKRKALPEIFQRFAKFGVAVTLAALDYGAYAIAWGLLAAAATEAIVTGLLLTRRPRLRVSTAVARQVLGYSGWVLVTSLAVYAYWNVDDFLVGKLLGSVKLGYYNFAYRIANLQVVLIGWLIGRMALPVFSKLKDDTPAMARAFLTASRLLAFAIVPVSCGMLLTADPLLWGLYGEKWMPAVPPLIILAPYCGWLAATGLQGAVFYAVGKPQLSFASFMIMFAVAGLGALHFISSYGITGVAINFAIGNVVGASIGLVWAFRILSVRARSYLAVWIRPLLVCAPSFAAALGAGSLLGASGGGLALFVTRAAVFSLCWLALTFALDRGTLRLLFDKGGQ